MFDSNLFDTLQFHLTLNSRAVFRENKSNLQIYIRNKQYSWATDCRSLLIAILYNHGTSECNMGLERAAHLQITYTHSGSKYASVTPFNEQRQCACWSDKDTSSLHVASSFYSHTASTYTVTYDSRNLSLYFYGIGSWLQRSTGNNPT